jgi:hypothetical protein
VGVDRPGEPDVPPEGHPDRRDDQNGASGRPARGGGAEGETRSRQECYDELRAADAVGQAARARQASAEEQATWEKWQKDKEESRWMWSEYQRKWPSSERPQADRTDDSGAWHGEGDRDLDPDDNGRVEAACDRIAKLEEEKITPALREVESQDPDRHLVGLKHCLKGHDRIKEKVCDAINFLRRSPEDAVSHVPDTIRYTLEYRDSRYTQGVWADITRLQDQGFKLDVLKNSWSGEQYKGINSQWIEATTGQRFEVQFHTRISFEAKQLTHDAYERLRTKQADKFEELVLEAFQKKVTGDVPVPLGATDVPDYSAKRGTDAR